MEGSHFFLTLPSDSSMNIYPNNTVSEFTVNLPQPLDLSGEWEVGLKEIQYPHTWNNVRSQDQNNHFYIYDSSGLPTVYILEPGYYSSVKELLQGIKNTIRNKSARDSISLTYNTISRRVTIEIKNGYQISLVKGLANILGFKEDTTISKKTTALNTVNLEGALHSLFVYSDVIQAQVVGDTMVPLLRIVNVEGTYGETISKTFQDPPYFPISRKMIVCIEVNIKDHTGKNIPFESGKLIVQLHFRQRRPLYL